MEVPQRYRLNLYGVFRLEREGQLLPLTSRKGRALLAVLALSARGERTRAFLQDTLWSRSQHHEAQGSLRRELYELRRSLGDCADDLLSVQRDTVRLRLENCSVDVLDAPSSSDILLEGLDLPGAEGFEEWLRLERQLDRRVPSAVPASAAHSTSPPLAHLVVALHWRLAAGATGPMTLVPDMLAQAISAGLAETGFVRVRLLAPDHPVPGPGPAPDVVLTLNAMPAGEACLVFIQARRFSDGAMLLSRQDSIGTAEGWENTNSRASAIASQCIEQLLHEVFRRPAFEDELHLARKAVFTAVEEMFSLNPADVLRSRNTWAEVKAIRDNGIFSAWQAYQAVFVADPAHRYDFQLTLKECRENMRRALEQEPFNGLVLALCAHVEAFLFRDFAAAWDLVHRAGLTGTQHVMYHDALSLLRFYSGRYGEARESARQAFFAGRNLSYRYAFATTLCMIEGLAGNYDVAIEHGQRALLLEPSSRVISYPPTLRYLGASLAHSGRIEEAKAMFGQLPEWGRSTGTGSSIGAPGDALPSAASADFVGSALELITV